MFLCPFQLHEPKFSLFCLLLVWAQFLSLPTQRGLPLNPGQGAHLKSSPFEETVATVFELLTPFYHWVPENANSWITWTQQVLHCSVPLLPVFASPSGLSALEPCQSRPQLACHHHQPFTIVHLPAHLCYKYLTREREVTPHSQKKNARLPFATWKDTMSCSNNYPKTAAWSGFLPCWDTLGFWCLQRKSRRVPVPGMWGRIQASQPSLFRHTKQSHCCCLPRLSFLTVTLETI